MLSLRSLSALSPFLTILSPSVYFLPYSGYYNIILTLLFTFCSTFLYHFLSLSFLCNLPPPLAIFLLFFSCHLSLPLIPFLVLCSPLLFQLSYLFNHGFHLFIHLLAFISFFASTGGSYRSGTLSERVRVFFRRPTLFSFSLAASFPCFWRFRHALSFLLSPFWLSPLTHSLLFTLVISTLFSTRHVCSLLLPDQDSNEINTSDKYLNQFFKQ
jgi:hypothetical protein